MHARFSRVPFADLPLFWRLFLTNGIVFVAGTVVLAASPATVSSPVVLTEAVVLAIGLAIIVVANFVLLRSNLAPLQQLSRLMERIDLLRPGQRLAENGHGEVAQLVRTFNAMLARLEHERGTSNARALAAQEAERQRIAQELHDEIGQSLTAVLLGLKRAIDRAPADLREDLLAVQDTARSSLDEVRGVARRLRPGVLEDLGLLSALSAAASDFSRLSELPVQRHFTHPLPALSPQAELVVYRIAQESLTNVARHAQATSVELTVRSSPTELLLMVEDDGRGIPDDVEGAGVRGMRERALLVGGELSVGRRAPRGTQVRFVVPLGEDAVSGPGG